MPDEKKAVMPVGGSPFQEALKQLPVREYGITIGPHKPPAYCECCGESGLQCDLLCAGCTHERAALQSPRVA